VIRLCLSWNSPTTSGKILIIYRELANRLADEKMAFDFLHLLHHLNGVSFDMILDLPSLNPFIADALKCFQRDRFGGVYRLYTQCYKLDNMIQAINILHPAKGNPLRSMVHAREVRVFEVGPDDWPQMKELARVSGTHCSKLSFEVQEFMSNKIDAILRENW